MCLNPSFPRAILSAVGPWHRRPQETAGETVDSAMIRDLHIGLEKIQAELEDLFKSRESYTTREGLNAALETQARHQFRRFPRREHGPPPPA
eukprot:6169991-Alexandrium_andersonii.AAC.1